MGLVGKLVFKNIKKRRANGKKCLGGKPKWNWCAGRNKNDRTSGGRENRDNKKPSESREMKNLDPSNVQSSRTRSGESTIDPQTCVKNIVANASYDPVSYTHLTLPTKA